MRQILAQNAFPLIRQMEIELYGYSLNSNPVNSHVSNGHAVDGHTNVHPGHSGHVQTYPATRPVYPSQTYPAQTYPSQPYQTMRPQVQQPTQSRRSVRTPTAPIGNLLRSAIRSIR